MYSCCNSFSVQWRFLGSTVATVRWWYQVKTQFEYLDEQDQDPTDALVHYQGQGAPWISWRKGLLSQSRINCFHAQIFRVYLQNTGKWHFFFPCTSLRLREQQNSIGFIIRSPVLFVFLSKLLHNAVNCWNYIELVVGELISMQHGRNDINRGNPKYQETSLFHCHPFEA